MMNYCPECGVKIEKDFKYCPNCGAGLKAAKKENVEKTVSGPIVVCNNCGEENSADAL
jgi:DNA-directed RNA polymerase subunit M/transcription elongation factor TFIIS